VGTVNRVHEVLIRAPLRFAEAPYGGRVISSMCIIGTTRWWWGLSF